MLNSIRLFWKRRLLNRRLDRERARWILLHLHYAGGCDADDPWSMGWDDAISFAIKTVENATGVSIEEALKDVTSQEAVEHQDGEETSMEELWIKDE